MSPYANYPPPVKFSEIAALEVFCALIGTQTHASFEEIAVSAVEAANALLNEMSKRKGEEI
jgi:hypothetical protein